MFRKAIGAVRRLVAGIFGWAAPVPPVARAPANLDPIPSTPPVERFEASVEPGPPPAVTLGEEPLLILGTSGQRAIFNLQLTEGPDLPNGRPVDLVLTEAGRQYLSQNGLL